MSERLSPGQEECVSLGVERPSGPVVQVQIQRNVALIYPEEPPNLKYKFIEAGLSPDFEMKPEDPITIYDFDQWRANGTLEKPNPTETAEIGTWFDGLLADNLALETETNIINFERGVDNQLQLPFRPDEHMPPIYGKLAKKVGKEVADAIAEEIQYRAEEAAKKVKHDLNLPEGARVLPQVRFTLSKGQEFVISKYLKDPDLRLLITHMGLEMQTDWKGLDDLARDFLGSESFAIPTELLAKDRAFWQAAQNHPVLSRLMARLGDQVEAAKLLEISKYTSSLDLKEKTPMVKVINFLKHTAAFRNYNLYLIATHAIIGQASLPLSNFDVTKVSREHRKHTAAQTSRPDIVVLYPTANRDTNPYGFERAQYLIDNFIKCTRGRKSGNRCLLDAGAYSPSELEGLADLALDVIEGKIGIEIIQSKIQTCATSVSRDSEGGLVINRRNRAYIDENLVRRGLRAIGHDNEPVFNFVMMALAMNQDRLNEPLVDQILSTVKKFNSSLVHRNEALRDMSELKRLFRDTRYRHTNVLMLFPVYLHFKPEEIGQQVIPDGTVFRRVQTFSQIPSGGSPLVGDRRVETFIEKGVTEIQTFPPPKVFKKVLQNGRRNPGRIIAQENGENPIY